MPLSQLRQIPDSKRLVINYGEGGGRLLQNVKIAGPKLFASPPQDRIKCFGPPISMAKTPSTLFVSKISERYRYFA